MTLSNALPVQILFESYWKEWLTHHKTITLVFINNLINIKERMLYNQKKKTHNEKKPNQNPPRRFVPLRKINLHLELFIGNPTRATAPPPGAVSAVFILILLRVIQAPGEAAAAQRTWQRAPIQVQILLCENTNRRERDREDVKTFTCTWGMVVSRSRTSCPLSAPPCLFTVLFRQPGMTAEVKGDKRIFLRQETSTGSRLAVVVEHLS